MQIDRGEKYPLLKPIYFVAILDFNYFESKGYLSHHIIVNGETHERKLKDIQFTFIESDVSVQKNNDADKSPRLPEGDKPMNDKELITNELRTLSERRKNILPLFLVPCQLLAWVFFGFSFLSTKNTSAASSQHSFRCVKTAANLKQNLALR